MSLTDTMRLTTLSVAQKSIGYHFQDPALLAQALTNRSYPNSQSNERLEFLGDKILNAVVAAHVYRLLPSADEGALVAAHAKLVCNANLRVISCRLNLHNYTLYGRSAKCFTREALLKSYADTLEAVIGAIYLDAGIEQASRFIMKHICGSKSA